MISFLSYELFGRMLCNVLGGFPDRISLYWIVSMPCSGGRHSLSFSRHLLNKHPWKDSVKQRQSVSHFARYADMQEIEKLSPNTN